jgi:hypothetical protein
MLTILAPPRVIGRGHELSFGARVQSIEHDRGACRHSHQIRRSLSKPLADTRRPLLEGGIEARAKCRDRSLGADMKLIVQTGGQCRGSVCSSLWGSRLTSFAKYWGGRFTA